MSSPIHQESRRPGDKTRVFFSGSELCRQRSSRRHRCRHPHQGQAQARTPLRVSPHTLRHPSVIEGFVWLGLDGILSPAVTHNMGAAFVLYAQGLLPFLLPFAVYLFEPDAKSRKRMLPFVLIGTFTTLYMLWALIAYPLEIYVKQNSIVYINPATNNTTLAILYVIATCGSLFFSRVQGMVIFGAANLVILLAVMAVKRYAFTSLWCAYAAAASIIILFYFWKSKANRPFRYTETT